MVSINDPLLFFLLTKKNCVPSDIKATILEGHVNVVLRQLSSYIIQNVSFVVDTDRRINQVDMKI